MCQVHVSQLAQNGLLEKQVHTTRPQLSSLSARCGLIQNICEVGATFAAAIFLSDTPSVRSVPMIILYISRSEPGVRPYPKPAFTSKRPILKSTTANLRPNLCPCHRVGEGPRWHACCCRRAQPKNWRGLPLHRRGHVVAEGHRMEQDL